jgi:hypothetical protein
MLKKLLCISFLIIFPLFLVTDSASALSRERWINQEPYGVFFNNYDPNFYTGFVPRVQEKERIKIHLGRGNQLRIRMVLSDKTIDNYLSDQVARHNLYKEVIDKRIIKLTSNRAWEAYHKRFTDEGLENLVQKKSELSPEKWRELNLEYIEKLVPGRLFHITKDFNKMVEDFAELLKNSAEPTTLEAKLHLINQFFPYRIFLYQLSAEQDRAFKDLVKIAQSGDMEGFRSKAEAFFHSITDHIYPVKEGKLDYYELTSIYAAGTHDSTTTYKGHTIPQYTTTGVWWLIPRKHGKGFTGMVDYISSAGYYGLMPMVPYEYGGGIAYNAIHNTGISSWIQGHPLLPRSWRNITESSRSGKPFNRVAITSRGPVSHGCTRLNSGHLTELREMLPSTSQEMEGILHYRNLSYCYDVFDIKGDGTPQVMGVQYYIAFRHSNARVATHIWTQNTREDFYRWLYGDEINYGPVGEVTFKEAYDCTFVGRRAVRGKKYENIKLYEASYEPEYLQFYVINGVNKLSRKGMDFNRELRRVGYGYTPDRKILLLEK